MVKPREREREWRAAIDVKRYSYIFLFHYYISDRRIEGHNNNLCNSFYAIDHV